MVEAITVKYASLYVMHFVYFSLNQLKQQASMRIINSEEAAIMAPTLKWNLIIFENLNSRNYQC